MSRIFEIADRYVEAFAALDPDAATARGIIGHETEMTDYSPDGAAAIAALDRRTLAELGAAPVDGERDRIARDVTTERLGVRIDAFDAGEYLRVLRVIGSPVQGVRSGFDQMPRATRQDWQNIATRLSLVPGALTGIRTTLLEGLRRGLPAARRQVRECAAQAAIWSGQRGRPSFFSTLLDAYDATPALSSDALRADIETGVRASEAAYAELRTFLETEYLPRATERDAAGRERYQLMSRQFNGCELDLEETYAWGWDELYRVEREMAATAEKIAPGGSIDDAQRLLDTDPARAIDGVDAHRAWLQEIHDRALADLDGAHFDIDPRIRRVEVMIPPAGGALAPYYSGPSEDFVRPGRTWWPAGTRTRFAKWTDVSTAYHEGVPGHHLQVGATRCLGDTLSRYQRSLTFVSGHGEGWALYAERLMGELGYLDNPDYYMGMLSAQAMRCVRVIIDIGMHLELAIPKGERFHPGETWDHALGLAFAQERSRQDAELMTSELVRYLGWPAQAISYKVGERAWLAAREGARQRQGASFDMKRFHTEALGLGPMGLEQLARETARSASR
jgi:uncharacterized protein (DUF885 family)